MHNLGSVLYVVFHLLLFTKSQVCFHLMQNDVQYTHNVALIMKFLC